ncbi:MAG: metal-dependent transcriptional regulator [Clostridiaceae bacterium]|nr:metal-dependent transcriptional regulator [Clostridiaceae bacterium]
MNKDFHTVKGYEMINHDKNLLTSSMEDYLEMIYRCSQEHNFVRLNTLAQMLNVKDSSASKMMKKLGDLSLINYEKYGMITLTDKGRKLGLYLFKRHDIIEKFLQNLTNNRNTLKETELIEHVISKETVDDLRLFNDFFEKYPDILLKYWDFNNNKKDL